MEDAEESETTVTTAVSTGTDRATLSLAVIPEFSQHTRFSNNNNQTGMNYNYNTYPQRALNIPMLSTTARKTLPLSCQPKQNKQSKD